jgi:K+-transporting ATPase A subunit
LFLGLRAWKIPASHWAASPTQFGRGRRSLNPAAPLFIGILISVVVLFGLLDFVPALALGPIAEQLQLFPS